MYRAIKLKYQGNYTLLMKLQTTLGYYVIIVTTKLQEVINVHIIKIMIL